MKKHWPEIFAHVLFWFICLWMVNQSFAFEKEEITEINGEIRKVYTRTYQMLSFFSIGLFAKALMVYFNAFRLLPTFFQNKNIREYVVRAGILIGLTVFLEFSFNYLNQLLFDGISLNFFYHLWYLNTLFYICFFGISVAYGFGKNWQKNERIKARLIREKLNSELDFLKSQINPHFLFNTLNNLFAIAERNKNPELSDGIAELSNLMRYMLYDCKTDFVPLEKEIRFLKSMIEIQQLRIAENDDVTIAFNIEGEVKNQKIAPLILIPFLENAFKHGIDFRQISFIRINFVVNDNQLIFNILNSKFENKNQPHAEYSGIGLENVKRRLELIYPNRHELRLSENEDVFSVELTLDF